MTRICCVCRRIISGNVRQISATHLYCRRCFLETVEGLMGYDGKRNLLTGLEKIELYVRRKFDSVVSKLLQCRKTWEALCLSIRR